MPKVDKYIKFENYKRKIKSPFIIYADFQSILVPEDNGKQNPEVSYTDKNQNNYFQNKFEMKIIATKDYCDLYLKYDVLLLVYVFEKFRNNSLKIID